MSDEKMRRAPERIEWMIIVLTVAVAISAFVAYTARMAVGVILGGTIAWLNFRWMRRSVTSTVERLTTQPERRSAGIALKFVLRYAVIFTIAYATLKGSIASGLGVVAGLLLIVPALMVEAVYEFYLSRWQTPVSQ